MLLLETRIFNTVSSSNNENCFCCDLPFHTETLYHPRQQYNENMQLPKQQPTKRSQQDTLVDEPTAIGGWQSDEDNHTRRMMIGKIVLLLRQRKPDAPETWLKKLPQIAKRLEQHLYRMAPSLSEYNNVNTLKQRLKQLAATISMKIQQAQMIRNDNKENVLEV